MLIYLQKSGEMHSIITTSKERMHWSPTVPSPAFWSCTRRIKTNSSRISLKRPLIWNIPLVTRDREFRRSGTKKRSSTCATSCVWRRTSSGMIPRRRCLTSRITPSASRLKTWLKCLFRYFANQSEPIVLWWVFGYYQFNHVYIFLNYTTKVWSQWANKNPLL